MKPTNNILIGDVLTGSEAAFLRTLVRAFAEPDTLILANFHVGSQQIDFVVVTPTHVGLIELKHFTGPVFGEINGGWYLIDAAGNRVPYAGSSNPYQQAVKEAYALSDAMKEHQRRRARVPAAEGGRFFSNFRTYVAIAPKIHQDSRVTAGDNKARVLSAHDVVDRIRTSGHISTWSADVWRRFSIEHLNLRQVTFDEAIDPEALKATSVLEQYRERCVALIGADLPPLVTPAADQICGSLLVRRMTENDNVLLIGPSGSAKTFHVRHAAMALLAGDAAVPIIAEAKRYRGGDFWTFLRHSLAPVHPADPKTLLAAIAAAGARPALIIDGLNECSSSNRDEMLKGAVAFALQYNSQTIITTQHSVSIPGLRSETLSLALPAETQKREIFAHHAGVRPSPKLDALCAGFRNAYELTIAGRCFRSSGGRAPAHATELYDRYMAACLPDNCSAVAAALARCLANAMGDRGSVHLTRHDCDIVAERFLQERGSGLTVLDELLRSRLINLRSDIITFEHELLLTYLRSSALEHTATSIAEICTLLQLPRNQQLVEFILPRLTAHDDIAAVLNVAEDVAVLLKAYDGWCGPLARAVTLNACEAFARDATSELANVEISFSTVRTDDGERLLVDVEAGGLSEPSAFETRIAEVIALRANDPPGRARFLKILKETETALTRAVSVAAQHEGFITRQAWSELLRLSMVGFKKSQTRGTLVVSRLASALKGFPRQQLDLSIREELLSLALSDPPSTFALYVLVEEVDFRSDATELLLTLVERAWATQFPYLQLHALFTLTNTYAAVSSRPELRSRAIDFLGSIDSPNLLLSSTIVEAQSHFEMFDAPVSCEDALAEMRAVIEWNIADELRNTFDENGQEQQQLAHSKLSRMFEDVFQGAYFEAYEMLSEDEQLKLLTLAALAPNSGFYGSWIVAQLLRLDRLESLPTLRKLATTIDLKSSFRQDSTAVFVLALYGFARYAEAPPARPTPQSTLEQAWFLIADALFWAFNESGKHAQTLGAQALEQLDGDVLLLASSVLSDIESAEVFLRMEDGNIARFAHIWPEAARRIANYGVEHRDCIAKLDWRIARGDVVMDLIKMLGEIGDATSIAVLRSAMNDPAIGRAAIETIRTIEGRHLGIEA